MRYFFDVHREVRIYQLSALLVTCSIVLVAFFYSPTAHAQSQPRLFITETNCPQIGVWNANTCTLTGDVDIPLIIQMPGITLDGNGYTITAAAGLNDATISLMGPGITVKNVAIRSTAQSAINILDTAPGAVVVNVIIHEPRQGVFIQAQDAVIRDVSVIGGDNTPFGLRVSRANNISITGLSVVNGFFGINVFDSTDVEISKSRIENVQTGVAVEFSNGVVLEQSILSDIAEIGVNIGQQSEIIVRNNQIKGVVNPGAEREGVRLTETNSIDNTVITGNAISNWDVGINDRTFYDDGGPIQLMFLDRLEVIWKTIIPTAWAQVIGGISIYNNNFTLNTAAYDIPIDAAGTVGLSQNQVGNYWDNYDQPAEGCVDSDTNQVCDNAFQNPGQIADEYPSTVEFAHQFEPVVSAVCSLYTADEVSAEQGITVRFTSAFADEIVPTELTGEIDYSTNTFQVTPTATGTQTVSAVVNGIGGSSECSTQVLVTGEVQPPEPTGASSVLFLPGIQASRLYKEGLIFEDKIWEPTGLNDVGQLAMTEEGESVNEIYTRDIVDELPITGQNIYKGLTEFLDTRINADIISTWESFPYDWRYNVMTIAETGTLNDNLRVSLIGTVERLAEENNSKVTLLAHSNGGLVAKALMLELEKQGKEELVDRIIFLASPQTGTPKALGALLHGVDQSTPLGLLMDKPTARSIIKNIPGMYGLLPTETYLDSVTKPVVTFEPGQATQEFIDQYGTEINNISNLENFLKGEDGRVQPDFSDLDKPAVANSNMIDALPNYRNDLDSWVAPSSVDVVEIVGVGLPTLQEIQYRSIRQLDCGNDVCASAPEKLLPFGRFDLYGDETVTAVSASAYSGDKRSFYLDLQAFEQDTLTVLDYKHSNISEVEEIEILLAAVLADRLTDNIDYISDTLPNFNTVTYEILSTHSPVTLSVRDSEGNETSVDQTGTEIKTEIVGSRVFTIAGSTYVFIPSEVDYEAEVRGYAAGSYTLRVEQLNAGVDTQLLSEFQAATVTPSMVATFSSADVGISNVSTDYDADGEIDEVLTPQGVVVVADDEFVSYQDLHEYIKELNVSRNEKRFLQRLAKLANRFDNKAESNPRLQRVEHFLLDKIKRISRWYNKRDILTNEEYEDLKLIIKTLKSYDQI